MAYTTPRTWVSGETVTAAIMNAHIRDNLNAAFPLGVSGWTSWVPTLSAATTAPTLGTGSVREGLYQRVGRIVTGNIYIAFGSSGTGAGSGEYQVSLPVSPRLTTRNTVIGSGYLYDQSANVIEQVVFSSRATDGIAIMFKNGAFAINNASPWAWAANDHISLQFTYEAAS